MLLTWARRSLDVIVARQATATDSGTLGIVLIQGGSPVRAIGHCRNLLVRKP